MMSRFVEPSLSNTLHVVRSSTDFGTFGVILHQSIRICDSLEPVLCDGKKYHGLSDGVYPLFITYSPRFNMLLPLIECLGRNGIRIHAGNFSYQSKGCVLVGSRVGNSLKDSRITLKRLIDYIKINNIKFIEFTHVKKISKTCG